MSSAIPPDFGTGHSGLAPTGEGPGPTLAGALRDAADDLAGLKPAAPTAADVAVLGGSPITVITTPDGSDAATTQALANATKAKVNALITRFEAAVTAYDAVATLASQLRARFVTAAAYVLKLTKG